MKSQKIDKYGGKVLKATQIRKLRGILKEKGIHLIVEGDKKAISKLFKPVRIQGEAIDDVNDLFFFMNKKGYLGAFDGINKQFILPKNTSQLVVFHEFSHLKHFEKVGQNVYNKLSSLEKETFVWNQIFANKSKWTKEELKMSLWYINNVREGYKLPPLNIKI